MFSIGFTDQPLEHPYDDTSVPAAPGRLVLGKSIEEFLANLSLWDKSDYESHWARELKGLFEGNLKAALVVSYDDPRAASNTEIWRVYREEELLYFQNQLLPYGNLSKSVRDLGNKSIYTGPDGDSCRREQSFGMGSSHSRC
jgi:hypothetical protein